MPCHAHAEYLRLMKTKRSVGINMILLSLIQSSHSSRSQHHHNCLIVTTVSPCTIDSSIVGITVLNDKGEHWKIPLICERVLNVGMMVPGADIRLRCSKAFFVRGRWGGKKEFCLLDWGVGAWRVA